MQNYIALIEDILKNGTDTDTRAGMCRMLTHKSLSFDMTDGFPRLTNRFVPFKSVMVELEGFIGGITSKKWYNDRGCRYWNEWANPQLVGVEATKRYEKSKWYGDWNGCSEDPEYVKIKKEVQLQTDDLGPIYPWQWRRFGQTYYDGFSGDKKLPFQPYVVPGDQLHQILNTLQSDLTDRRMECSCVNINQKHQMALPACHNYWKVDKIGAHLDLFLHMRSLDVFLGGPADIQLYAVLLHLLSKHANLKPGKLTLFASNAHLYHNLIPQCEALITREDKNLPHLELSHDHFWDWDHTKAKCLNYEHSGKLSAKVSV